MMEEYVTESHYGHLGRGEEGSIIQVIMQS